MNGFLVFTFVQISAVAGWSLCASTDGGRSGVVDKWAGHFRTHTSAGGHVHQSEPRVAQQGTCIACAPQRYALVSLCLGKTNVFWGRLIALTLSVMCLVQLDYTSNQKPQMVFVYRCLFASRTHPTVRWGSHSSGWNIPTVHPAVWSDTRGVYDSSGERASHRHAASALWGWGMETFL